MSLHDNTEITRATAYWHGGESLKAGRVIFEYLPPSVRPAWALRILRLVVEKCRIQHPAIDSLLLMADRFSDWHKAYRAFHALRKSVLRLEAANTRSKQETLLLCVLYLAENTAKVVYNGIDPPDEFDEDSGWWVVSCLEAVLRQLGDVEFSSLAWSVVCHTGTER